jgi:hypothetical protein
MVKYEDFRSRWFIRWWLFYGYWWSRINFQWKTSANRHWCSRWNVQVEMWHEYLSALLYMSVRFFNIKWEDIDQYLKKISFMTTQSPYKWATVYHRRLWRVFKWFTWWKTYWFILWYISRDWSMCCSSMPTKVSRIQGLASSTVYWWKILWINGDWKTSWRWFDQIWKKLSPGFAQMGS